MHFERKQNSVRYNSTTKYVSHRSSTFVTRRACLRKDIIMQMIHNGLIVKCYLVTPRQYSYD